MSVTIKGVALLVLIFLMFVMFFAINGNNRYITWISHWLLDAEENLKEFKNRILREDAINDCITSEIVIEHIGASDATRTLGKPFLKSSPKGGHLMKDHKVRSERFYDISKLKKLGSGPDITSAGSVASGIGSTLNFAQEAMATLHVVINDIKQKFGLEKIRLLDVPCGDFQWMFRFLQTRDDVIYTGIDIVPDLIKRHKQNFKGHDNWRFVLHDAVQNRLNESYDLILVRHLLQHLPHN